MLLPVILFKDLLEVIKHLLIGVLCIDHALDAHHQEWVNEIQIVLLFHFQIASLALLRIARLRQWPTLLTHKAIDLPNERSRSTVKIVAIHSQGLGLVPQWLPRLIPDWHRRKRLLR